MQRATVERIVGLVHQHELGHVGLAENDRARRARDGDGGGAGVAESVQIDEKPFQRQFHPVCNRFDDPQVGLVWNETGDLFRGEPSDFKHPVARIQHRGDRLFVGLLAVHLDPVETL